MLSLEEKELLSDETPSRETGAVAEADSDPRLHSLIPSKLSYIVTDLKNSANLLEQNFLSEQERIRFVTTDLHQQYSRFVMDFGPVNIAVVHRFCCIMSEHLDEKDTLLVYCIDNQNEAIANTTFLLGAYLVLVHAYSPQQACSLFADCNLLAFRDASPCPSDYDLTLLDCLKGLEKAVKVGWFDIDEFNIDLYEHLDRPSIGHINQITPKFVAFKGPLDEDSGYRIRGELAYPPGHYISVFRMIDVSCVIRLNEADTYDKREFECAGIRHHDLFFDDCTIPSHEVVERFLAICSRERKIAIHCRAGLGRTGTLIAVWMMRHAGFSANEAIAWLRILRPGSVIGQQQQYLKAREVCDRLGRRQSTSPGRAAAIPLISLAPAGEGGPQAPPSSCSSAELARKVALAMRDRELARVSAETAAPLPKDSDGSQALPVFGHRTTRTGPFAPAPASDEECSSPKPRSESLSPPPRRARPWVNWKSLMERPIPRPLLALRRPTFVTGARGGSNSSSPDSSPSRVRPESDEGSPPPNSRRAALMPQTPGSFLCRAFLVPQPPTATPGPPAVAAWAQEPSGDSDATDPRLCRSLTLPVRRSVAMSPSPPRRAYTMPRHAAAGTSECAEAPPRLRSRLPPPLTKAAAALASVSQRLASRFTRTPLCPPPLVEGLCPPPPVDGLELGDALEAEDTEFPAVMPPPPPLAAIAGGRGGRGVAAAARAGPALNRAPDLRLGTAAASPPGGESVALPPAREASPPPRGSGAARRPSRLGRLRMAGGGGSLNAAQWPQQDSATLQAAA